MVDVAVPGNLSGAQSSDHLRSYVNSVAVRGGPFDLTLDFAIMRGAEDSQAVASLTMSWHHLRLMIEILQSTLEKYEEITGSQVPDIPMESDAVTDSDGGG